jgi:formylmethanofuran dehydrogenase subunit E
MLALSLDESLTHVSRLHRHLCPRQVLGVRMGMLAGCCLDLSLPQTNKRLFVFTETDGCFADGVSVSTGCWLGRRTLRLVDYGKVAATFVDTRTARAIRIAPRPDVRSIAARFAPGERSRWHTQLRAYQCMPDDLLLDVQPVIVTLSLSTIISRPNVRVNCVVCGEEVINEREVLKAGQVMCRACAGERYYTAQDVMI